MATNELNDAVTDVIRRHVAPEHVEDIAFDQDLAGLGLDSLALAGLVVDIENSFMIEFPADMINPDTFRSVRTVADALDNIGAQA